ncbi:MAG: BMP family ABC transporter substrate-binding protein [Acidimicrobiia bacterium]|nr:BMP family ABC transporter substrate-binding protein [Acidimicrobiia bacterium]
MSIFKRRFGVLGLLLALSLVAAACADDEPADTTTTTQAATTTTAAATTTAATTTTTLPPAPAGREIKACQVSDTGGIDDKSFNETAWVGAQAAEAELEGVTEVKFLESQQTADFRPNIDSFISEGCDLIVTVGFLLADDTASAAADNPDQRFAIIDYPSFIPPFTADDGTGGENVRGLNFNTDEAAFLAGYLAAGATQTGIIGTFGGINIPPVTIFMDGLVRGVDYYNAENGTSVQVLGWDPETAEGLFTGNFESTEDGRSFGVSLMDQGADIILPVAGPVGLGTAAAAAERDGIWIIGVDSEWTDSAPEFADIILTSIRKRMDNAVFATISNVLVLDSLGNEYFGTLANDGVGLGVINSAIPQALLDEVDGVRTGIINGLISVTGG